MFVGKNIRNVDLANSPMGFWLKIRLLKKSAILDWTFNCMINKKKITLRGQSENEIEKNFDSNRVLGNGLLAINTPQSRCNLQGFTVGLAITHSFNDLEKIRCFEKKCSITTAIKTNKIVKLNGFLSPLAELLPSSLLINF
ncbi:hypothetical protein BpHYR1_011791 [Brachionus plicatilis]|uniref:Uncharacterized protein n=1 Tax=Brachionus plicatilis TaxID=10195 RepID=A0A3M7P4N0_BRAPC|nr:hypothetical protein BpHYR1_011791 [Brachionus plicatilis]